MSDTDDLDGLVISREFRLAYDPIEGQLWRLDQYGVIRREVTTWHIDKVSGRYAISSIWIPGLGGRGPNRVIFCMMSGRWPQPGMDIDHINRDVRDNRWVNLRECTRQQNIQNRNQGDRRICGADEVLEQNVCKTQYGTYAVTVSGNYYGSYKSRIEANQVARQQRRRLYGEFALAPVTWRRIIRPSA